MKTFRTSIIYTGVVTVALMMTLYNSLEAKWRKINILVTRESNLTEDSVCLNKIFYMFSTLPVLRQILELDLSQLLHPPGELMPVSVKSIETIVTFNHKLNTYLPRSSSVYQSNCIQLELLIS